LATNPGFGAGKWPGYQGKGLGFGETRDWNPICCSPKTRIWMWPY